MILENLEWQSDPAEQQGGLRMGEQARATSQGPSVSRKRAQNSKLSAKASRKRSCASEVVVISDEESDDFEPSVKAGRR